MVSCAEAEGWRGREDGVFGAGHVFPIVTNLYRAIRGHSQHFFLAATDRTVSQFSLMLSLTSVVASNANIQSPESCAAHAADPIRAGCAHASTP